MNLETLTKLQARRTVYMWKDDKPRRFGEWIAATDGHGMIAIRSAEECEADANLKSALNLIETPLGDIELPLAPLKEALDGEPDGEPYCLKCSNTGLVDCDECDGCGEIDCECDECGDEHTYKCKNCSGGGQFRCECGHKTKKEAEAFFLINGIPFDKWLVRDYVLPVEAEAYRFALSERQAVHIGGDDWRVILMPMQMYDQTKPVTKFEMK